MNKTITKVAIGAFVALTFIVYSTHQRSEGSQAISKLSSNSTPQPSATAVASATPAATSTATPKPTKKPGQFKDGSYTGKSYDAFYGFVQVRATVSGGKLSNVEFLDYPQDRSNSIEINQYAMPILKSQAIQIQSALVDGVSGATDTSQAFIESLSDALAQARA